MDNTMFEATDMNAMLAEMENQENAGKTASLFWSPKSEGITPIRFLKPLQTFGEKLFFKGYKIHYVNGRSYFCLNQTMKDKDGKLHEAETCPFCQRSKAIYNASSRGTPEWDKAGSLRAKDRYVSRVLIRGNKNEKGENIDWKPEFYEFGSKIYNMIKDAMKLGEIGDFLSLKEGRDFNLSKKGQKRNTDYSGSVFSMKTSSIFPDLASETGKANLSKMMAELPKMSYDKLITFVSPETMKQVLDEMDGVKEEAPVTDVTPDPLGTDAIFGAAPAASVAAPQDSGDDELEALLNSI